MTKLSPGKWAEREVYLYLESCSRQAHDFAFHRFPDAKAARGILASQPSDYLVCADGIGTVFLEVKESANPIRLPKAKVSQWGTLYKFHLAGAKVVVLVYQSAHRHWVYLTNGDLFSSEDCPASFVLTGRKSFSTAAEALQEIFK